MKVQLDRVTYSSNELLDDKTRELDRKGRFELSSIESVALLALADCLGVSVQVAVIASFAVLMKRYRLEGRIALPVRQEPRETESMFVPEEILSGDPMLRDLAAGIARAGETRARKCSESGAFESVRFSLWRVDGGHAQSPDGPLLSVSVECFSNSTFHVSMTSPGIEDWMLEQLGGHFARLVHCISFRRH